MKDGRCAVPCTVDSDCLHNDAFNLTCTPHGCQLPGFRNDSIDETLFVQCLTQNITNYVHVYMKSALGITSNDSDEEYFRRLYTRVVGFGCLGTGLRNEIQNETACENAQFCNWRGCEVGETTMQLGDNLRGYCSAENCEDNAHWGSDFFCGDCSNPYLCREVSVFAGCIIFDNDYIASRGLCEGTRLPLLLSSCEYRLADGYSWNPLSSLPFLACKDVNSTNDRTKCLDQSFCCAH